MSEIGGVGAPIPQQPVQQATQQGELHRHREHHGHGKGHGKGLALGKNEEFIALRDAKKAGELEGPMGAKVGELITKLRTPQEVAADPTAATTVASTTTVVTEEAALVVEQKAETREFVYDSLNQIVTLSE